MNIVETHGLCKRYGKAMRVKHLDLTVPEGAVFVMGDNRNDSHDSRAPDLGPVDTRYIMGRAVAVLIPGVSADTGSREWFRAGILS